MTAEVVELPSILVTLYGIQHGVMIPLVTTGVKSVENVASLQESTLNALADNAVVVLSDTLIFTDKFDCFTMKTSRKE